MKMNKETLEQKAINVRIAMLKIAITACFGIIFSLFLFSCSGGGHNGSKDSTATDSTGVISSDTSRTASDSTSMSADTSMNKPDTVPLH
jgi:hypothetical protein